jgi:hypothetical protein
VEPRQSGSQWYCVYLDPTRRVRAVMNAFQTLLVEEYVALGRPENCRVYRRGSDIEGYTFFFSPIAAVKLDAMLKIWKGIGISEPTNLQQMDIIV